MIFAQTTNPKDRTTGLPNLKEEEEEEVEEEEEEGQFLIEFQSLRGGLQSADAQTRNHLPLPYLEHRLHNLNNLVLACELKPVPIEIQPTLDCFLNT